MSTTDLVKQLARENGFDRCGIASLGPIQRGPEFLNWLSDGRAGTMGYLHRRKESRLDPSALLAGGRSAIVVAVNYNQPDPTDPPVENGFAKRQQRKIAPNATAPPAEPAGRIAMYAWGEDYHVVLTRRLERLLAAIRAALPDTPFDARVCVDAAPILERELAAAAGVGWIGKNTLVMHQDLGSYFFLGEILTTLDLVPDAAATDHCGACTRCLDACPTGAFPAPYEMDATRCISYLTIEYRGDVPEPLHAPMGDWVFGCDVCQEVCPHNRDAPITTEPRFRIDAAVSTPSATDHDKAATGLNRTATGLNRAATVRERSRNTGSNSKEPVRGEPAPPVDSQMPSPIKPEAANKSLIHPVRPDLLALVAATDEQITAATAGRATDRARPHMWRRNASIALKNS
jgi:epoxyqueuosine reductase